MSPPFQPLPLATPKQHLYHLVIIRAVVLLCLYIGTALSYFFIPVSLDYKAVLGILVTLSVINILTLSRLKQALPVTDVEFFTQLLIDVFFLSILFYYTGGANNPFVFYFLVPICISAATLSRMHTWLMATLCISSYTLLFFFFIPLPAISPDQTHHSVDHGILDLHVLGMWVNFFISAVLITLFVVRIAQDLRNQHQLLAQRREDQLRDEQLLAVASLAAGTAHELGTPLSTIKILLTELRTEYHEPPALQADLKTLTEQVEQCAATLRQLVDKAEQTRNGTLTAQSVRGFCHEIIERWQVMRPDINYKTDIAAGLPEINHAFHPTISQSVINLLNNAADASVEIIDIQIQWNQNSLRWRIEDDGPGVPLEIAESLGKAFFSTKGDGLGLGLFLTHATLSRYGGQVRLYNRRPRGTITEFSLPLNSNSED